MNRNTRRLRAIATNVIDRLTCRDQLASLDTVVSQSRASQDVNGDTMTWKNGNLLPSDGTLNKHISAYVKDCVIGDGVDVEIGEGAIVIGCTFTRAFLLQIYDYQSKELEARHKIVIGPMSIVIGCAFRDSCKLGTHTRAVQCMFTQVNIGNELIAVKSAALLRYGSIGDNAIMFHSVIAIDPGTVGNNALFMDGMLAVLNPDDVANSYVHHVGVDVTSFILRIFNMDLLKSVLLHKSENQIKAENAENKQWEWGHVSCYEKCFINGDKLPSQMKIESTVPVTGSWSGALHPLYFQVHDDIREDFAKTEKYYDHHENTSEGFYGNQKKRIKIGDNVRVLCNAMFRMGAISANRNYHSGYPSSPKGYMLVGWNKCVRHDYDFLVGNDVTFMCHNTWMSAGYPANSDCVGRLVLEDGATIYYDRFDVARSTGVSSDLNKTKMVVGYSSSNLPCTCSLTVGPRAKLFLAVGLKCLRAAATSVINTLTVNAGQTAII